MRGCTTRACVTACPANLFVPTSDGGILFNYEQCFECGTCYLVCNDEGAHQLDATPRVATAWCSGGRDRRLREVGGRPPEPGDERFAGISAADQAAVEVALRQGALTGDSVVVVTAGPPAAERALRDASACGAAQALRIDLAADASSEVVAAALAGAVRAAAFVWCGDYSTDRGSGSVPAFLAGELGARQALGVVAVELAVDTGTDGVPRPFRRAVPPSVAATRRLDGGRREVLRVMTPAVVSVEGAAARLRRASLGAVLAARTAPIEVRESDARGEHLSAGRTTAGTVAGPVAAGTVGAGPAAVRAVGVRAYRPRARALPPPHGSTLERLAH